MKVDELLKLLEKKRDSITYPSNLLITADKIASYIPDIETAEILFNANKKPFAIFEYITGISRFVQDFLQKLISIKKIEKVLDPWANLGEMLYLTEKVFPEVKKTGYVMDKALFDFNNLVNAKFEQHNDNPLDLLSQSKTKYDLIISNLPVGLFSKTSLHGLARTDLGLQIILECLPVLNDSGLLISTVNSTFFQSSNAEKFKSILIEKGFCIKAIFGTPVKSINQYASIPFYFVIIEKGIQEKIFLAEINDKKEQQAIIIKNFRNKKNAKDLNEGILIPIDKIQPIPKILANRELDLLLKRTGLPLMPLNQFGEFKNLEDVKGDWLIFSKNPTKEIGLGISKEDLNEQFNYFFQIDSQVIEPEYLLELLNSSLGNKILNSVASGSVLKNIKLKDLQNILLPVEIIQSQRKIIDLERNIKSIEEQFSSLRLSLWNNPKQRNSIEKIIKKKLKDPKSIDWMEELPFPLASILWGYHSESMTVKKVEYLFLFFEGLCEFLDILLLSAVNTNKAYFDNTVKLWLKNDEMQDWYVKSSFGGWQKLHEKLAKNIRTTYNKDEENKKFIKDLFSGANEDYINILTSKEFVNTFSEIIKLRNDYKGHGGITSENKYKEILISLETKFFNLKEKLVIGFSNVKLLSPLPKTMDWDDELEVFNTTCLLLKGTRSKFNQIEIQTNRELSSKKLYLLHDFQFSPLEVLPLVQMRETPRTEQNACYFYNRIDGDKVRMVSYHFDKESELYDPIAPILDVFKILNPFG